MKILNGIGAMIRMYEKFTRIFDGNWISIEKIVSPTKTVIHGFFNRKRIGLDKESAKEMIKELEKYLEEVEKNDKGSTE